MCKLRTCEQHVCLHSVKNKSSTTSTYQNTLANIDKCRCLIVNIRGTWINPKDAWDVYASLLCRTTVAIVGVKSIYNQLMETYRPQAANNVVGCIRLQTRKCAL